MEKEILNYIRLNPFISQQELANKLGLSRSAIAGYISSLTKKGEIKGRAYVLKETDSIICIGTMNFDSKAHATEEIRTATANPVKVSESCGGVARNVAENLARLGMNASLVSCIGNDKEGMWVMEETRLSGVDISQVKILPDERTGTYTAVLDTTGEMFLALANLDICQHINRAMLEERWSHIAAAQTVFLDANLSEEGLKYVIERCEDERIDLYIDPVSLSDAQKLPENLSGVHTIFPNRDEASFLAGGMEINTLEDCRLAAQKIKNKNVRNVIITLGEDGVFYSTDEEDNLLSGIPTDVVDATGAGDAFAAGYLVGIVKGENEKKACEMGLMASHLTLQTTNSVSSNLKADSLLTQEA